MEHPNNSWTKPLEHQARQIHADDELRSEVFLLKTAYMNNCQALLHNDLHAGSIMLNHGLPVLIVSKRLGHAKPSITLDIYGHLIPSMQEQVAQIMDEVITPIELDTVAPRCTRLHQGTSRQSEETKIDPHM